MNNLGGVIKVRTLEVAGIYPAIFGMRNPLNSWTKSDSYEDIRDVIGTDDMILAKKLIKAGTEHRKFLRQIQVWADVFMPRYVWQELDTYKFGTKNSCSTMYTIMKNEITMDDFYIGEPSGIMYDSLVTSIDILNILRDKYLQTKDYKYVIDMKRILPESFIQLRTWNTNYEELANIYHQRNHHKLKEEWGIICQWIEELPYFKEMILDTLEG